MSTSNPWPARLRRIFTWNTLVVVRRELSQPLPGDPPQFGDKMSFRWATVDDLELFKELRPSKAESFIERLRGGREMAFVSILDGKFVSYCWYEAERHHDAGIDYTFEAGPGGVYQWEGWVVPPLRKHGMSKDYMKRMYTHELPQRGFTHVLSYYSTDNEASRAFHAHFDYREVKRLLQVRVLGRYFYFERPTKA